ncbi:EamA family transporter RarD [Roseivivax isoporae]|uniref:RarD n=1 Tax=Roseivivax isoporae LMG 25204 TaxID=1449351 RepID=X7F9V3_9RHOB|nr:EamA family transporter RarD [Roseivivax isoporae]ETX29555.1 RarD [Roseivivax isoporae LMG 25204]
MQDRHVGLAAMVAACTIWGLSPLYYKLLTPVPALEVLAHRTFWSFVFFAGVLALQGRLRRIVEVLSDRRTAVTLAVSASAISVNWFLFIYSVQTGHATQASLGYYIFPLLAVLIGMAAFGERLDRTQVVAVALAALAVTALSWHLGAPPWIALLIALSFGIYGAAKKKLSAGAVTTVTTEVLLLAPLALGYLALVHAGDGPGRVYGQDWGLTGLLMLAGPLTALPLILFSHASQRLPLGTIGLLQYLNPTLQFLCATLVFREPFGWVQAAAFGMIWTALALYSGASFRKDRARRRASRSVSTESHV